MMRTAVAVLSLIACVPFGHAASVAASSAAAADVDTSRWRCRFCPYPEAGTSGSVRAGVGYVGDDAVKFGEHTDLAEEGAYVDAAAELTWRGTGTRRWRASAQNVGLETRSLLVAGGEQGRYRVQLLRDTLVDHNFADALTPYRGVGSALLTLPDDWVRAPTTTGMQQRPGGLQEIAVGSKRHRTGLGIEIDSDGRWRHHVDYRHERREGKRASAGAFLVDAVALLEPVDYRTHELEAGMRYQRDLWHIEFGYTGSVFRNEHRSLIWDNPFTATAPGADRGAVALAPDNQSHSVSFSGAGRLGERFHLSGNASVGYLHQDEDLLEPTSNASLIAPALPRDSAEAEATLYSAAARLRFDPAVRGLSASLAYRADIRDNDTKVDTFTQVVMDSYVGGVVRNEPLSWARHTVSGTLHFRLDAARRFAGGVEYERYDRDYGADPSTDEYRVWGQLRSRLDFGELKIRLEYGDREGSNLEPAVPHGAPQNPLMRWFDVADRERQAATVALMLFPRSAFDLTLRGEVARSDFDDSRIGRTKRLKRGYGVELGASPADNVSLFAYALRSMDASDQRNSQAFGAPDWKGQTDDDYATLGAGLRVIGLRKNLDLELDLTFSDAESGISLTVPGAEAGIPDIENERFMARLGADYQVDDRFSLNLGLVYESLRRRSWQLDGVSVDTVPGFLSLGVDEPDHDVVAVTLSATYEL